MLSQLTATSALDNLSKNLVEGASRLTQLPPVGEARRIGYLKWAEDQHRMLKPDLSEQGIQSLIFTPRYTRIVQNYRPLGDFMINDEILDRRMALEELQATLERWRARWADVGVTDFVVPDTNVLVMPVKPFEKLDWRSLAELEDESVPCVVIPHVVLTELDGLKLKGQRDVPTKARTALRTISDLLDAEDPVRGERVPIFPGPKPFQDSSNTYVDVLVEPLGHRRQPTNDSEIIVQSLSLRPFVPSAGTLTIISDDTAMRFLARSNGLRTRALPDGSR